VYTAHPNTAIRYKALEKLLEIQSPLLDVEAAKKEFIAFMRSERSFFKSEDLGINNYGIFTAFDELLLEDELKKKFFETESQLIVSGILHILKDHKYSQLNRLILERLGKTPEKNVEIRHALTLRLSGGFGAEQEAAEYLAGEIKKGQGNSYFFGISFLRLQSFFPEGDFIDTYFENVKEDYNRAFFITMAMYYDLIPEEKLEFYIDFILNNVLKFEGPYSDKRILNDLYKYEDRFPKITSAAHEILQSDYYPAIVQLMRSRGLRLNEMHFVKPLLTKELKLVFPDGKEFDTEGFKLGLAAQILYTIYGHERKTGEVF
jgi:hypothetical protein